MKKILPFILKYVIAFGLAGFLVWLSLRSISPGDRVTMRGALAHAKYLLIIPVFILLMLSHIFRVLRWQQLIEPMGYKPPVFDLLCALLVGYVTNQLIPRGGEIVRCTSVARQHKIPTEKLIGTIISERVVDVLCLLILGCAVFFVHYASLSFYVKKSFLTFTSTFKSDNRLAHWLIGLSVLVAFFLILYIIKKVSKKTAAFFSKLLKGFWEGFVSIKSVSNKWKFGVYTVLIWVCYIFTTWIGCFGLKETTHLPISTGVTLLISGTLGIIVSPGGLGAYPWAIQQTLLLYGIGEGIAKAFGWLLWLAQFLFTIIFGTLAYIAINMRSRRYEKHSISTT